MSSNRPAHAYEWLKVSNKIGGGDVVTSVRRNAKEIARQTLSPGGWRRDGPAFFVAPPSAMRSGIAWQAPCANVTVFTDWCT
jgi:hypothetical protein